MSKKKFSKKMSQRKKNLRDVVDNVFRRASPTTPQKVVQEVLSDDSKSSNSQKDFANRNFARRNNALPYANFTNADASITLPAANVTPIESSAYTEKQSLWYVLTMIALILAAAFCVIYFWSPIRVFVTELFTEPNEKDVQSTNAADATTNGAGAVPIQKNVIFDESKNTVRFVEPANKTVVVSSPLTTLTDGSTKKSMQASFEMIMNPTLKNVTMPKKDSSLTNSASAATDAAAAAMASLELSLDNLAKTNLDLQAQRDAAIQATNQREQGAALRLSETDQYSMTDRLESIPVDSEETKENVRKIYGNNGGNNVVGNREMAPFVTFAPGEEPFEGMVPDYDEKEHGDQKSMLPPLQPGRPHGILELINDHCMRTGKPMPKAGDRSTMDIMSKKDTGDLAPMRVAEVEGHYLQSQKKQMELARLNSSAIKKIYAHKDAVSAGQILDRGDTLLGQFAQGDDAVQYLNIHSL